MPEPTANQFSPLPADVSSELSLSAFFVAGSVFSVTAPGPIALPIAPPTASTTEPKASFTAPSVPPGFGPRCRHRRGRPARLEVQRRIGDGELRTHRAGADVRGGGSRRRCDRSSHHRSFRPGVEGRPATDQLGGCRRYHRRRGGRPAAAGNGPRPLGSNAPSPSWNHFADGLVGHQRQIIDLPDESDHTVGIGHGGDVGRRIGLAADCFAAIHPTLFVQHGLE